MMATLNDAFPIEIGIIRHGHWIEDRSIGDCCYKCSECGFIRDAYLLEIENYCPRCGAKMDNAWWEEPEINPCRGCADYDGHGGCKSNGGCGVKRNEVEDG